MTTQATMVPNSLKKTQPFAGNTTISPVTILQKENIYTASHKKGANFYVRNFDKD